MILGLSSFTFGWSVGVPGSMPAKPMHETDLVSITLGAGLRCLQLGDNLPLHELSTERQKSFKKSLSDHRIRFELGARKLTPDHLQHYLELANAFNAPLLRFVIDGTDYTPDAPEIISIIRNIVPFLKEKQIVLGIENHDRFKARELASIIEAVGSEYVGVCLDCVNSIGAGEGLEWVSDVLVPYTVNVHLKDFTIQRFAHNMGFTVTGTPAGKGMTDIPALLERLLKYGRCKSAILEQWVTPERDIEASVVKEMIWATEGLHYLKSLKHFKENNIN